MIDKRPKHPGEYVRAVGLNPKKLTVTQAAKLLGVGRPALSNFLNGKVGTTPEMAGRVERALGIPARTLLDMQMAFDAAVAKRVSTAKRYVPPFLDIKANDIEGWSTKILSRSRLAVLVRTLVNSTGVDLKKVDFPGNDDAERAGWDGYVEAAQATPWIPAGLSGWEFGTTKNIKSKADSDFAKSVEATSPEERADITFVFITPRRWPGKSDWVTENGSKALWKDVRAYDSSDLEQWLGQSIAAQVWFANETNSPSQGVRSLDRCWSDWANVAAPPLVGSLFAPAVEGSRRLMQKRLSNPPLEPTIVAADSTEEALAFLAQLFGDIGGEDLRAVRDRVLVFDEPGVLPKLAQGGGDFIAVVSDRDIERELGPFSRQMHSIVVYPRNATSADRHIVLEPLNHDAFRTALEEMGFGRDDITRLSNESGRSLTVLRRRCSRIPAIKTPEWAAEHGIAQNLVPFLFIGAWNSTNSTDQAALQLLADARSYDALEKECQRLARINDAPLWSVGTFRGVISKIDLLFAISSVITVEDLRRYFEIARIVLGEDDPRLDLPEDQRWAASIYGKSREFSGVLRAGISETLVLLALHGKHLFGERLGVDCEFEAVKLVRELLTPLRTRLLEANDRDLPLYAEAAPEEFLSIIEEDLRKPNPETCGLMRPAVSSAFGGGCVRTGLLWALEGLAWNPRTLPRTALILARLAEIEIDDNWLNKPINSLHAIFRAWMPQTAASHDDRVAVIKLLIEKHAGVAWKICIAQLNVGHETGHYSHKPTWRPDGHGFGEPFPTWGPIRAFMREVAELVLNWSSYDAEMICDLVERLPSLNDDKFRGKVWGLIKSWADAGATDLDKALVREKIRVTVMSRRAAIHSKQEVEKLSEAAKAAYVALEPSDLLNKHEWLFRQTWIEESADDFEDEDFDYRKHEERTQKLRADALREIVEACGLTAVVELAERGKAAAQIGWSMARDVLNEQQLADFIIKALPRGNNGDPWPRKSLVSGALRSIRDEEVGERVLAAAMRRLQGGEVASLLLLAPFRRGTWRAVDQLDEAVRQHYWEHVPSDWIPDSEDELNEGVDHLLKAQRPRAAFACAQLTLEKLKPQLLYRVMREMLGEGKDPPGQYRLERHYLVKAFSLLDENPDLSVEQKAQLELAYIDALVERWERGEQRGIPNLESYLNDHPELYVQAIVWTYKRRDEGDDPPALRAPEEKISHFAELGHKLLDGIARLPGRNNRGELNADLLLKWVKTVRNRCEELGRSEIADVCLGQLLARTSAGKDGVWPCEIVRHVMEEVRSPDMMRGAHTERYNSRGVVWRGEGGEQERELADNYTRWASALQFSHPFVSSELLLDLAKTYENEADQEDARAGIRRRLAN